MFEKIPDKLLIIFEVFFGKDNFGLSFLNLFLCKTIFSLNPEIANFIINLRGITEILIFLFSLWVLILKT